MRRRQILVPLFSSALLAAGLAAGQPAVAAPQDGAATDYLVLMKGATVDAAARRAITEAGGTITDENSKLGYAYVRTTDTRFAAKVAGSEEVAGAARERVIGSAPKLRRARTSEIEKLTAERKALAAEPTVTDAAAGPGGAEPLANLQWDMRQIGATPNGSYAKDTGSHDVRVGIIDTGVDGTHPDVAPNFDNKLSANFVVDNPTIDGPCEHPSCKDPANEDDDGHGTHVASTIGSPINGIGIAGVAPGVDLVNIRAGQDSGYFFLQPTLNALTYAGDIGVDVVNMSFYIDPWLFNCTNNPADSAAEQSEQRVIRTATQRALNYAVNRGVLPVAAMGNEATDLGRPTTDDTSPDFPEGTAKDRTVDNSCLNVPTESKGVVAVSSTGPSTRKAYYSNYGTEQTDISAPGGDAYDTPTNTRSIQSTVLAAYPKNVADAEGTLNADGTPKTSSVVRDCRDAAKTDCSYYQYLQGTSMASPHAAGVAALVVSAHGKADRKHGGLTLAAAKTESLLYSTARKTACPSPRTYQYTRVVGSGDSATTATSEATCSGPRSKNGFYGRGLVNANNAVR